MTRISEATRRVIAMRIGAEHALARVRMRQDTLAERIGRHPLAFVAGAAVAGVIVGRLLRLFPARTAARRGGGGAFRLLSTLASVAGRGTAMMAQMQSFLATQAADASAKPGDDQP